MYRYIKGLVTEKGLDYIVLEVSGIGYQCLTSLNTLNQLSLDETATLYTVMIVREDEISLCGFAQDEERRFFEYLTAVSGIGKKNALSMLSASHYEQIASMIIHADEKGLVGLPSIGKKTAQRLIVELKDKLSKEYASLKNASQRRGEELSAFAGGQSSCAGANDAFEEALMALKSLGFHQSEVYEMLKGVDLSQMSAEDVIRTALSRK